MRNAPSPSVPNHSVPELSRNTLRIRTVKEAQGGEHLGVAASEVEQVSARDPQRSIAIGKNAAKIGIGEIGNTKVLATPVLFGAVLSNPDVDE